MSLDSPASSSAPRAAADEPGTRWQRTRWLWIACASYVLLRALILYTAFDQVALWAYELYMCGTVARSMLGGGGDLPLPYFYDNAAGPVLMGLVVAPCYAVFGSSYLVLKLVPMTLGLGVLVLSWLLLRRLFDVRAANCAALLIAFAPTTLTKYTLIGAGNHSENLFFTLLATWSFFEMHARDVNARRLAVTGLFAGWAFAIFIGALTPLGLLAIAHFGLRGWRLALRDVAAAIAGFALGFAPVVWLNLGSGGRGLAFLAAKFGDEGKSEPFLARLGDFFSVHLPAASTYPSFLGVPGRAGDLLFLAATLAAFVACAPSVWRAVRDFARRQREREARAPLRGAFLFCVWAYLPLTALAYAKSNLKIAAGQPPLEAGGYRYFLPHFLYAIVLIAIAASVGRNARSMWTRRGSVVLAGVPLALGAFNFALIDFSFARPNVGAHYEGHNFARVSNTLMSRQLALPPESVVAHIETFAPLFRARAYTGAGYAGAINQLATLKLPPGENNRWNQPLALAAVLSDFPSAHRADVARGIGTALRQIEHSGQRARATDEEQMIAWLAAGEPFAAQVVEGLAFEWAVVASTKTERFLVEGWALFEQSPAPLRSALARGFGHACGRLLRREIAADRDLIVAVLARVPREQRAAALAGLGAGLADGVESPRVTAFAVGTLQDADAETVLSGFAARAREIWGELPADANEWIEAELPKAWHEHWQRVLGR